MRWLCLFGLVGLGCTLITDPDSLEGTDRDGGPMLDSATDTTVDSAGDSDAGPDADPGCCFGTCERSPTTGTIFGISAPIELEPGSMMAPPDSNHIQLIAGESVVTVLARRETNDFMTVDVDRTGDVSDPEPWRNLVAWGMPPPAGCPTMPPADLDMRFVGRTLGVAAVFPGPGVLTLSRADGADCAGGSSEGMPEGFARFAGDRVYTRAASEGEDNAVVTLEFGVIQTTPIDVPILDLDEADGLLAITTAGEVELIAGDDAVTLNEPGAQYARVLPAEGRSWYVLIGTRDEILYTRVQQDATLTATMSQPLLNADSETIDPGTLLETATVDGIGAMVVAGGRNLAYFEVNVSEGRAQLAFTRTARQGVRDIDVRLFGDPLVAAIAANGVEGANELHLAHICPAGTP